MRLPFVIDDHRHRLGDVLGAVPGEPHGPAPVTT